MIRILAGEFKGRKLLAPPTKAVTRPITSAARKSLFDMLASRLEDATVLDLFCGTGTLGIEALSRGARACRFAESDRAVVSRLRRNLRDLGLADRSGVWSGDVLRRLGPQLGTLERGVDLAFVDPPYAALRRWDWLKVERRLFAPLAGALSADGLVVLRAPDDAELPERLGGLEVRRRREYGQMVVALMGPPEEA